MPKNATTLNIAALWGLPVLFVCENNLYGMSTHIEKASSEPQLWKRAAAYNIASSRVDGNDLGQLLTTFREVVDLVRTEQRPAFVECMTYRWTGHSKSDPRLYRTREEEAEWRAKCPIRRWATELVEAGLPEQDLRAVDDEVRQCIEAAATLSQEAAPAAPEELHDHVWAN